MHYTKEPLLFLDTMNTQKNETTKAMPYELVFGQSPRSILIPEPWLKGTINEEQLDEKDGVMYKADEKYSMHNGYHIKQFAVGDNVSI